MVHHWNLVKMASKNQENHQNPSILTVSAKPLSVLQLRQLLIKPVGLNPYHSSTYETQLRREQ